MADIDPKRSFLKMQQERGFWLYVLRETNSPKDHRFGRI